MVSTDYFFYFKKNSMAKISFLGEGEKGFRKVAAMPSKHLENAVRHFGIIDIISTTVMKG